MLLSSLDLSKHQTNCMIGISTNNSKSRSSIDGSDRFANFNKNRDIVSARLCEDSVRNPRYVGRTPAIIDTICERHTTLDLSHGFYTALYLYPPQDVPARFERK